MLTLRSLFILLLTLAAVPASAVVLTGPAEAVDGDTLDLAGERVRLLGIDAPELDQPCRRDGAAWACGRWAQRELAARLRGQVVSCEGAQRDRYGRLIATCRLGDRDLGRDLVREGRAFAYRRYSMAYVPDEAQAARAGQGLWAGSVEWPEDWRHRPAPAADGCAIKGNISDHGLIYHRPGQRDYARVRIDPGRGERWFCREEDALAAGWRPAQR